jgi:hypothetical protein
MFQRPFFDGLIELPVGKVILRKRITAFEKVTFVCIAWALSPGG